jgi:polysaccharide biosynthesis protein PslJ
MHRTTPRTDDALGAVPALRRSGGADAVTLLSILVVVRLALPSQFVIGPLGGAGAPATLFGLLLVVYWLWHRLRRAVPERAAAVNAVAVAFGAIALASQVVASSRPVAADELSLSALSLLILASWLGGLLLASDGVTSPERLRVLVSRLAIMGGAFAGFGLVQFVTGTAWVDRLSIPGLVANTPVYSITQREGFSRPFSTAIHPIEFGSVIAMLLPLTIVFGLLGPSRGGVRWRHWIPAALTVLAASLSSSRSTLVGLALGLVLLWPALTGLQRVVGGVATIALGAFVFVTVPGMVGTISGLFGGVAAGDSSVASRVDSFAVAAGFFGRAPILGRGFGTFLPRYRIFDNQYLLGLVETGVLGLAAMVLLWVVPVVGIARVIRKSDPGSPQRLLGTGLLASCAVGGVGLAFFDGFGFPMMPAVWFVLLGLGGAYRRLARATSS